MGRLTRRRKIESSLQRFILFNSFWKRLARALSLTDFCERWCQVGNIRARERGLSILCYQKIIKSIHIHFHSLCLTPTVSRSIFFFSLADELCVFVYERGASLTIKSKTSRRKKVNRRCHELLLNSTNERRQAAVKRRQRKPHSWNEFLEKCNDSIRAWWKIGERSMRKMRRKWDAD